MFGKNKIRKQQLTDGFSLEVREIFHTIQGEGPYAGMPAVFLRLSGCNLKCWFCDTDFDSVTQILHIDELFERIQEVAKGTPTRLVVVTGGEPFRQNLVPLFEMLQFFKWQVQVETAGTLWIPRLENLLLAGGIDLVCSPKTPRIHPQVEFWCRHYKYILRSGYISEADGLPTDSTQVPGAESRIYRSKEGVRWVQACDEYDEGKNKANQTAAACSSMQFGYRLSLQLHKVVGLP